MLDIEKFIAGVHDYIARTVAPLVSRIKSLEDRQPEKGDKGIDGRDGVDGKDGANGIDGKDGINGKDGADGINGKDGADGLNGKDAEPVDVAAIVGEVLSKVFASDEFVLKMVELAAERVTASIYVPKDGKDGADGMDGKDADESAIIEKVMTKIVMPQDGKSVTLEDVAPMLDELVAKRVAEIPAPKDGRDGVDGKNADPELIKSEIAEAVSALPKPENGKDADPQVIREMVLQEVAKIPVPTDGKSVTVDDVRPILEVEVSRWAVDFERRAHDVLQTAVDRLPKPKDGDKGDPGNDGFGIQEFVQRGERTVVAIYKRGDELIEQEFKFPALIDRGVFKSGADYEQGDGVTYGGSFWIAQKDNSESPGNSDAWRLAVKRGKDGKDAV